jgi:U3 small nucleolar RNA-associated protein 14
MEKEIQQILDSSENFLDEDTGLTEAEEKALQALSIEEARARHLELRKTRALLSYREAKLNRQNKIKSKSYHKMLKREKLRKSMKEFEELKQKDPTKALEKLQELEKLRIQERASLKHLKTGKWSKINKIRAKYDQEARDKLAEQLNLNKDLMRRLYEESDESEKSEDEEIDRKLVSERSALMQSVSDKAIINEVNAVDGKEVGADELFERNYSNLVEKMNVDELQRQNNESRKQKQKKSKRLNKQSLVAQKQAQVDEGSASEAEDNQDGSGDEDEEQYKRLVSEALAEDDVIEDFHKDKQNAIEEDQGKSKDTFLPGWGRWGGNGIQVKDKLRKKYVEKAAPIKRKDRKMKNVIISEKKDQVIAKYLVSASLRFLNICNIDL